MLIIFGNVLVIFSMVGLGFLANKTKILPYESSQYFIRLMLMITTPCLILYSITEKEINSQVLIEAKQIAVSMVIFYLGGSLLACLIVYFMKITPADDKGVYRFLLVCTNSGFMGFPIAKAVFGAEGLFVMVIGNIFLNFFLYSGGILLLHLGGKNKLKLRTLARAMCNLCLISSVVGMIMFCFQWKFPSLIVSFLQTVGDMTIPLSMLIIGIQLGNSKMLNIMKNGKLMLATFINLILWPAIAFACVAFTGMTPLVKCIVVLTAALPSAAAISAIVQNEGKNAQLAAEGIAVSTFLSMVTIPIISSLLLTYLS